MQAEPQKCKMKAKTEVGHSQKKCRLRKMMQWGSGGEGYATATEGRQWDSKIATGAMVQRMPKLRSAWG